MIKHWGKSLVALAAALVLASCASLKDYESSADPAFDLFDYFNGSTTAYGLFQDSFGVVKRRFVVEINGTVEGDTLTLVEDFVYNDGETQQRIWTIKKTAQGFVGTAPDVASEASGKVQSFAFNWQYHVDLPYKDSSIRVHFDDWMYQVTPSVVMNQADVSKFGVKVGEVQLTFFKDLS